MEQKKLTKKQEIFLDVYHSAACNISLTCRKVGISRAAFYKWMESNLFFKEKIEEENEGLLDLAESKLMMNINDGKEASIFFFLKTKGKKRGYIETVQQDIRTNTFEQLMKKLPKKAK